jgi:hypothetical protein
LVIARPSDECDEGGRRTEEGGPVAILRWAFLILGAVTVFNLALIVLLLRSSPGERARKARRRAYRAWAPGRR